MQNGKIKAAVYLRLANESLHGDEIDLQRKAVKGYVVEQGYSSVTEYSDNGYTGCNFDRPAFMQMDDDIKQGKIDVVITRDISRIGRNYLLVGNWLLGLEKHGTQFITTDGFYTTADTSKKIIKAVAEKQTAKRGKY